MKKTEINKLKFNHTADLNGSCLCGGVQYRIEGKVRGVVNCYCTQCQKTSGHHVAATRVKEKNLKLIEDETLKWYESSQGFKRGFCGKCGGNLFWKRLINAEISVMAGTLDKPTGLKTVSHMFAEEASDYFDIPT
ncbi:MAG: GFA family protein [Arenicellales bacterium]